MRKDSNFLGKEPINKLLFKLAFPAVIAMITIAAYNIIDAIFIGKFVGTQGLAGVAIAFPLFMLFGAIGQMLGQGGASLVSRRLGQKKKKEAERTIWNVFFLAAIASIILTVFTLIFLEPLLVLFGASADILPFALSYSKVLTLGAFTVIFGMAGNNIIRSEGSAKAAMIGILIGTLSNIPLDWLFIVRLDMGLTGAALATTLAHALGIIYGIYYFFGTKRKLKYDPEHHWMEWPIVKEVTAVGFPSLARQFATIFVAIIMNRALLLYGGDVAIAMFGVLYRMLAFMMMIEFGVIQGMQPIVGFNYGAKKYDRTRKAVWQSVKVNTVISLVFFLLFLALPTQLISVFSNDPELLTIGASALHIISIVLPLVGFQVVAGGLFQALGKAKDALIVSLLRQAIFFIPLLLILPLFFGLQGVFYAFPVADGLAFLVTIPFFRKEMRELRVGQTVRS